MNFYLQATQLQSLPPSSFVHSSKGPSIFFNDNVLSLVSSCLSISDCASLNCSSKYLRGRAEIFLWRPLATQMGLTTKLASKQGSYKQAIQYIAKEEVLAYLMNRSTKTAKQLLGSEGLASLSLEKFEIFIQMAAKLPQARFQKIFSSKVENFHLFHTLLKPTSIPQLQIIFNYLPLEKLTYLFNQQTDEGLTFLHIACNHNNQDFMIFVLSHIPDQMLECCLKALTKEKITPLLHSVIGKYDESLLAIVRYAKMKGKLDLLLAQRYEQMESINFMQYLCVDGRTEAVQSILMELSLEERRSVLSTHDKSNHPLFLTLNSQHFDTFHVIINLVPDFLFFVYPTGQTLLHEVCRFGIHEAFEHIDRYLNRSKDPLKLLWKRLLTPKDKLNDAPPLFYLAQCKDQDKAILTLKKIEGYCTKEERQELLAHAEVLHSSLCNGVFKLASYLTSHYPSLTTLKDKGRKNIWHCLALPQPDAQQEPKRIEFFKRHSSAYDQLNEITSAGNTPLSLAYQAELDELAKHYIKAGALPSIHKSIYSSKLLANHWSIKGDVFFGSTKYNLDSWHYQSALKEIAGSLKGFGLKHTELQDLIEAFSIFELPTEQQLPAMKKRAAQNKIWIKPLVIKLGGSHHVVTIIGSPKLVVFFNRAPYSGKINGNIIQFPASMISFIPPPNLSFDKILDWKDNMFFSPLDILFNYFIKSGFKGCMKYLLKPQKIGNCPFASSEGAVFAYMGLSKIQESDKEITEEMIVTTFDSVKPLDKEWRSFNHWRQFYLHREVANQELVEAIESLALVRFAQKIVKSHTSVILSLTKDDPSFFPLRKYDWNELSKSQEDFFSHLSQTHERYQFIRKLASLGQIWLNMRLIDYIREKHLNTLKPLVADITTQIALSQTDT